MTALHAVGAFLVAFAGLKLWIVRRALRERRAYRQARAGHDPTASFARPWLFACWIAWRLAAAALALAVGGWLLLR